MRTSLSEGDILKGGNLGKNLTMLVQETAARIWNDDNPSGPQQRSGGKLGLIEEQIDEIVTDVKQNLNQLFKRGE